MHKINTPIVNNKPLKIKGDVNLGIEYDLRFHTFKNHENRLWKKAISASSRAKRIGSLPK